MTSHPAVPPVAPPARRSIAVIAAVGRNGVIGRDGALAWRDPQDARFFRDTTMGAPVIMGRKTWDSLPPRFRPLPGRRNLVVTRNPAAWRDPGAQAMPSLDAALAATLDDDAHRVFVIGGAQLYAQALHLADELVLSEIDADLDGDVRFPAWDRDAFVVVSRDARVDATGLPFAFVTYRRLAPHDGRSTTVAPGTNLDTRGASSPS